MKRIEPIDHPLQGDITVPGDKSIAHRAVILGSVAHGRSRIFNLSGGDDNSRTVRAFRQMGVEIFRDGDGLCVDGKGWDGLCAPGKPVDCGNSGTTMRLLSGLLAGQPFKSKLDGDSSLRQRPMQRIIDPLGLMGAEDPQQNGQRPGAIGDCRRRSARHSLPLAGSERSSEVGNIVGGAAGCG